MKFYTHCITYGNNVFYRGIENGVKVGKKIPFKPTLFIPSNKQSKYKTIYEQPVEPIHFDSINDAKEFIKNYQDVDNFVYYGNTKHNYVYLSDEFPNQIEYDFNQLSIAYLDIETDAKDGFPSIENPFGAINAITVKTGNKFYVFGLGKYETEDPNVYYHSAKTEVQLIEKFLDFWEDQKFDIISGWNINFFDIPYIVNRIIRIMGEDQAKRLSPWKILSGRLANFRGKTQQVVDLVGISTLDYIELYTKFQPKRESNKLNYIAYIELGEKKISYDEYGSLHTLYQENFQKFIDYNMHDADLVSKLEEKLQLINMSVALAYDAKVNFVDVFMQVRMWDAIIFNHLRKKNIVLPQVKQTNKDEKYAGAYVKSVKPGMYNWVVSFDLDALYPNIIAQWNLSPETLKKELFQEGLFSYIENEDRYDVSFLLEQKFKKNLESDNISLAANGHCFSNDKQGFLPEILMRMYEDRKLYKKKMLEAEKEVELIKKEIQHRGLSV